MNQPVCFLNAVYPPFSCMSSEPEKTSLPEEPAIPQPPKTPEKPKPVEPKPAEKPKPLEDEAVREPGISIEAPEESIYKTSNRKASRMRAEFE